MTSVLLLHGNMYTYLNFHIPEDDCPLRLGRPLKWIGFEHMDAGHPHVHVVAAGYGGEKQVGLYERALTSLRVSTEREKIRQANLERLLPVRGRELTLD